MLAASCPAAVFGLQGFTVLLRAQRARGAAQVIAQHLFHTGNFRVGELFVQEAGVPGGEALKEPFTALHEILVQVCAPGCRPRHHCIYLPSSKHCTRSLHCSPCCSVQEAAEG